MFHLNLDFMCEKGRIASVLANLFDHELPYVILMVSDFVLPCLIIASWNGLVKF